MKNSLHRHHYTLLELITYIAVIVTISSGFLKLFHSTVIYSRKAVKHAESYQQTQLILREWRKFINASQVATWRHEDGVFHAGEGATVAIGEQTIVFTKADGQSKSLLLPSDSAALFLIDQSAAPPVAVLVLTWSSKRVASKTPDQIRLVACVPYKQRPEIE